ncbi:MAG: Gfo/Idh/MocA family oxidoreductase [Planctomycetes bacterium]|nr:Gfo/Idh/MocA family oxidoreductase [Planctomycetota bacterium]
MAKAKVTKKSQTKSKTKSKAKKITTKKKIIQIGIIGGGMIAQAHMNNIKKDKRVAVRWVADISEEALRKSQKAFDVPYGCTNYKDMLKDEDLDACIVCTPPSTHKTIGFDVMRAKKHLLLEKPLATTVKDCEALVAEAKKHPRLKISGCSARHARLNPKYEFVKKIIDSGKIGDVYHIHHQTTSRQGRGGIEYNPNAKWFLDRKIAGGGPLFDWGVYDLSFHLGIIGQPKLLGIESFAVNGLDKLFPTGKGHVEEHGGAWMKFKGGLTYYWERGSNAHMENDGFTKIYGSKGGLKFIYTTWAGGEVEFFDISNNGKGKPRKKVLKTSMKKHDGDMEELGKAWINYLCAAGPRPIDFKTETANIKIMMDMYKKSGLR